MNAKNARSARRLTVCALAGLAVVATVSACGAGTSAGSYVGDAAVDAVAAQLRAEGRAAYYLGPEASGLALTDVTRVTENGPDFQVWASYGTCHNAPFGEGGCMDPLSVGTRDWRADATGLSCERLEPQLGVPAGLVMGELTLFTGRALVSVIHVDDLADYDGHRGLALLDDLRVIGAARPVGTLPPPDPTMADWVDTVCGTVPGATVEHPIEGSMPAPRTRLFTADRADLRGSTLKEWTGTSIVASWSVTSAASWASTSSATPLRAATTRSSMPS